jgi:hypothetical protein
MKKLSKIVVAGVGTAALAAGIGAGLAFAARPTPPPRPSPAATAIEAAYANRRSAGSCGSWLVRCTVKSLWPARSTG